MPGIPKHPSTRQRRNKASTARTLKAVTDPEIPALPAIDPDDPETGGWHDLTLDWWEGIWSSPMAPEYDVADQPGLVMLAMLVDQFWMTPTPALLGEIRLQRQCFGLTPLDRRRLQWEIDRGEEADARTQERAAEKEPAAVPAMPDRSDTKARWVTFAVDVAGMSKSEASKMSKPMLIKALTTPADPRSALA